MSAQERLAREWHSLSDHAADGTPFGGGLCNCILLAERLEKISDARFVRANETITELVRLVGDYQAVLECLADMLPDWGIITADGFREAFATATHGRDLSDLMPKAIR